jgi:two-component sensor histidine kinase
MAHDVTDRKAYEDQLLFLMRDINHRAKNMLSLVQAVARQTAAGEPGDLSSGLMSAYGRSQPIKTYSSETSGRESMSRRWRAHSLRILRILSGLGSLSTARSCV